MWNINLCERPGYLESWQGVKFSCNLIQRFVDLRFTQRCLAHLSVVLHQECNILFIIKPVYLFDLSCYRIIGEKKTCIKGLHTASCHGNFRESRDGKFFVPSLGVNRLSLFCRAKTGGNKKQRKDKPRDTETAFSSKPSALFSPNSLTFLSCQTIGRMPDADFDC